MASSAKRHVINLDGERYRMARRNAETRVLCGRALGWLWNPKRPQLSTLSRLGALACNPSKTNCPECFRLVKLTAEQLDLVLVARLNEQKEKRELARVKRQDKRVVVLQALDARIAAAQVDAIVCLDYYEQNDHRWLRRCTGVACAFDISGTYERCGLEHNHATRHRLLDAPSIDTDDVVDVAIEAHKRSKNVFDRGDKGWIFKNQSRMCEMCGAVETGNATRCWSCNARLASQHAGQRRDLVCRFCTHILIPDVRMGRDFRNSYFGPDDNRITVGDHTTICALRFLGKVALTSDADLPEESFVLVHDEVETSQ